MAQKISTHLLKKDIIKECLIDAYIYGFELIISSLLGIGLILSTGFLLKAPFTGLVFLICIMTIRSFMGGYHAKNYTKCNLFLLGFFLVIFYTYKKALQLTIPSKVCGLLLLANILITAFLCPIDNKNKRLSFRETQKYKKICILLLSTYSIFAFILIINQINIGVFILIVLTFLILTSVIEKLKREIIKYEKKYIKNRNK